MDKDAVALAREKYKEKMNQKHISQEVDGMGDEQFLTKIKLMINGKITHVGMLLLGNSDYDYMFQSGAIWAMKKKYREILASNFDANKINGLLDKQYVWFKTDNKARLNTFKEQIEAMFGLIPIDFNVWENARDTFIEKINYIVGV